MELTARDLQALHVVHDTLNGTTALLDGLSRYDGIESEVEAALSIIADTIETDRERVQHILGADGKDLREELGKDQRD